METTIEKLFKNSEDNYLKIKDSANKKVVDWIWSKGSIANFEPYYSEEFNLPKQKKLKSEPKNKIRHTKNGLDNSGRIILEIEYDGISQYETYYEFQNNNVISYRFSFFNEPKIINCSLYSFEKEKLIKRHSISNHVTTDTFYQYNNNVLIARNDERFDINTKEKSLRTYHYEYDKMNILNGIREGEYYWYLRKQELTLKQLFIEAENRLLVSLKEHIKNNTPKEKIFTIVLGYDLKNYFPFTIAYGLESEREILIKEHGAEYVWEYQQYELFYEDVGSIEEDNNLYEELNQHISIKEKEKLAEKSILDTTLKLKNFINNFKLNTTEDFTLVITDHEMVNFKKHFKKINPEKFNDFKKTLP